MIKTNEGINMVIEQKQTHIAYHCPHCGMAVLGYVGEFALAADMLKIKCDCGKSALTVTYTNDKKIRLSVPCLFCENPHHFVVSQDLFFKKDIFLLGCPYMGMDVCFIGKPEELQLALNESAKQLNDFFEKNGLVLPANEEKGEADGTTEAPVETEEEILPDDSVYDIIHFLVKDLEADRAIDCPCGTGPYETEILPGGIRVFCAECGAEYFFAVESVSQAEAFLQLNELTLLPKEN